MTKYITCSKDMSEVPETACTNNCAECELFRTDWEELMLQISDVMREANRLRPIMTHEEAVRKIKDIVKEVE